MTTSFADWIANRELHEALAVYGAVRVASWDRRIGPELGGLLRIVADELLDDVSELASLADPTFGVSPLPDADDDDDDDVVAAAQALARYAQTLGMAALVLAQRDDASSHVFRRLAGAASARMSRLAA